MINSISHAWTADSFYKSSKRGCDHSATEAKHQQPNV